jgi:hypothetical protein
MSFSENVQNLINDTILKYIDKVSIKYKINKDDLVKMWNSKENSEEKMYDDNKQKVVNGLSKLTKPELEKMCKSKGLKTKGTKAELIEVLSNDECKKTILKSQESINTKLIAKVPSIAIKRNKFNNYEHEETSFVFDNKEKKVYGKQNSDGSISQLTKEDINLCNKYKFAYVIPDNLDSKSNKEGEGDDELEEYIEDDLNEDDDVDEDELEEVEEEEEEFEEEFYE